MRRNGFANRLLLLGAIVLVCIGIIALSAFGFLRPIENLLSTPLTWAVGIFSDVGDAVTSTGNDDTQTITELETRNAELERQLAQLQGELITLREIASDYDRLAELLDYTNQTDQLEFVAADVIGDGQYAFINSIIINRGTRDGLTVGMPVVTDLGLVGRIWRLTANTAQVQLITDRNSFVSARLQNSRAEGTVQGEGLDIGSVELLFVELDVEITAGELVYTSGLGGNFPADLPIGQVIGISNVESELTQQAQVSSLINFTTLEQVLVVTNFEPTDLSVFDDTEE